MHWPWWRLVAREDDFELPPPNVFCDLVGQHARHATPGQDRSQHRANAVARQAWREMNRSHRGRTERWRKRPGTRDMLHGNHLVPAEVRWLRERRMALQVARGRNNHAARFADPGGDHRRVGELAHAKREVYALLDQIDLPLEEHEPHGYCRIGVHKRLDDRQQSVPRGSERSPGMEISTSSSSASTRRHEAT
jgi:hypothetical protein